MFFLRPRLNYSYSIRDFLNSLTGIFHDDFDSSLLDEMFGTDNIFFVNHARTGIRIALNSLNLPDNAIIGVQAINCHTVFEAISKARYKHEFIDVNDNFQLDLDDLRRKKSKIDALIVTHLFGIPADMDEIIKILEGIPIIEDCAHSFLSKYEGRYTGTIGDIGVFSFGRAKFPSLPEGGLLVLNNTKYFENINAETRDLKSRSILDELLSIINSSILNYLHHPLIYRNLTSPILKRLDRKYDFLKKFSFEEKKILRSVKVLFIKKFNHLQKEKRSQVENFKLINKWLNNSVKISTFDFMLEQNSLNWNVFMVPCLINNSERDEVINFFKIKGIELGKHFSDSINWAKNYGYQFDQCPNSEKLVEKIVTFPTYCDYSKYIYEEL